MNLEIMVFDLYHLLLFLIIHISEIIRSLTRKLRNFYIDLKPSGSIFSNITDDHKYTVLPNFIDCNILDIEYIRNYIDKNKNTKTIFQQIHNTLEQNIRDQDNNRKLYTFDPLEIIPSKLNDVWNVMNQVSIMKI